MELYSIIICIIVLMVTNIFEIYLHDKFSIISNISGLFGIFLISQSDSFNVFLFGLMFYLFPILYNIRNFPEFLSKIKRNSKSEKLKNIESLKQIYQNTKKPILLIKTQMSISQNQTRQIVSGALLYQTPKTYTLEVHCKNISDKIITAVEFEIETRNAFNEIISTFSKTSSKRMIFDNYIICSWESDSSVEIQNTTTVVKRVMFSDGTTWNK